MEKIKGSSPRTDKGNNSASSSDVSIKINQISGTGRYEVITSGAVKRSGSGRTVVITSPRALAFPKKG